MKSIVLLSVIALLSGCQLFGKTPPPPPEIKYVEIKVPVPKTPMPPNTDCPAPDLGTLTQAQVNDNSELVKSYRITVAQLKDCSDLRQKVLDKYREMANDDEEALNNIPSSVAPFSMAPFSSTQAAPTSEVVPGMDAVRELQIERDFSELEKEFEETERDGN